LEVFELPYLVALLGIQVWGVTQLGIAGQPKKAIEQSPVTMFQTPHFGGLRP
jgi:hypothetical protein